MQFLVLSAVPLSRQALGFPQEAAVPGVLRGELGLGRARLRPSRQWRRRRRYLAQASRHGQSAARRCMAGAARPSSRPGNAPEAIGDAQLDLGGIDAAAPGYLGIGEPVAGGEQEGRAGERRQHVERGAVTQFEIIVHGARPSPARGRVRGGRAARLAGRGGG